MIKKVSLTCSTVAYGTGDLIDLPFTLSGVIDVGKKNPILKRVLLTDLTTLAVQVDVFICDASMAATTSVDNGAMVVPDGLITSIIAAVPISTFYQFDDNSIGFSADLNLTCSPADGGNSLYGFVVCRGSRTHEASDLGLTFMFA